jgi:membrane fusion protein (multidrug efflux system)
LATAQRNLEQARSQARAAAVAVVRDQQDLTRAQTLVAEEAIPQETLDHAKAAYDSSVAQAQAAQERIGAALSQVNESRASLEAAQQQVAQSQAQVLEARAQVGEAQAQARDFASRVDSARSAPHQVRATKFDTATAEAEVLAARAALEQAELNLSYTEVRALMDGRVSKRQVEVGDYVQPGQVLISQVSLDKWVVANFKETQLTTMVPGQKATIWVDAYPGVAFPAHVDSLQPGSGSRFALLPPENASGNWVKVVQRVPVKLVFDRQPEARYNLEPGMSVEAEVEVSVR